ncbi:hypothetical protein MMC12_000100, partial [Toensbergia leucococca]|nr:hypothetical protein [Toensbergia leucococca]
MSRPFHERTNVQLALMGFPQLLLLNTLLGIGALYLSRSPSKHRGKLRSFPKLYICIVTKGNNIATVRRTCHRVALASQFDRRFEVVILTDAPCAAEILKLGVRVKTTPTDFTIGNARFKARSLEYLRTALAFSPDDWILHLDEESIIDEHALKACIKFIEEGKYDFGQ